MCMNMKVKTLFNELRAAGVEDHRLCKLLEIGPSALRSARTSVAISGRWYGPLKQLADANHVACPMDAFSWSGQLLDPEKGAA